MITRNVRIINYHFEYSLYRISEACHRGILTICTVDHPGPGYHFCPQILVTKGAVRSVDTCRLAPCCTPLHCMLAISAAVDVISPPSRFPDKLQQLCHVIGTVMLQLDYYKQLQQETCTRCIPMKSYEHTWILECMGMYINMYSTYSTFWLALEYQEGVSQLFYGIGYCKGSGVIAVTLHCERDRHRLWVESWHELTTYREPSLAPRKHMQHRVPKESVQGPRINLTWRWAAWTAKGQEHPRQHSHMMHHRWVWMYDSIVPIYWLDF